MNTEITQSSDFVQWVKTLKTKIYSTKYEFVPHDVAQIPWG
jgi:hypothetical protein